MDQTSASERPCSASKDRQRRWREKQQRNGLVQVRAWVPADREKDLLCVAAAWREGRPGKPPTPKQIYDMNKLLKAGHRVPRQYREDSYLLEIWITRERFR